MQKLSILVRKSPNNVVTQSLILSFRRNLPRCFPAYSTTSIQAKNSWLNMSRSSMPCRSYPRSPNPLLTQSLILSFRRNLPRYFPIYSTTSIQAKNSWLKSSRGALEEKTPATIIKAMQKLSQKPKPSRDTVLYTFFPQELTSFSPSIQ
jgi:hypothetical protein